MIEIGGQLAIGKSLHTDGPTEATFGHAYVRFTPHADPLVVALTDAKCGDAPWQRGKVQDVSSRGCLFVRSVTECAAEYDLVHVVGERLALGVRGPAGLCREADRPTAVETGGLLRAT